LTGSTNQTDIYPDQIAGLRIPRINAAKRIVLLKQISAIEKLIATARAGLRESEDIINESLCSEFAYPLKEHRERAHERHFVHTLGTLSAGFTLRNSTKFHHPAFELTARFYARVSHVRIRRLLQRRPVLGAQISPSDFEEDGERFYLTPAAIKTGQFDESSLRSITEEFYDKNQWKVGLQHNDVVLGASGEGMGKIGLFNSAQSTVISQFIMRLRFSQEVNPVFAWLFMRSIMFQPQIERSKRGINIPNIFPDDVERMLIVSCSRTIQEALARDITAELKRRADALAAIEANRKQIHDLIEEAIQS
jgi:hypothetical protein